MILPNAALIPPCAATVWERVGKSFDKLVKIKGKIVSRKILPISLSYDHRIIDGAEGARFCVYLSKCLGKDFAFKLAV